MGLPHRNSSVFKQAHVNQCEVKERIRMDPRFSARVTKVVADIQGNSLMVAMFRIHLK